MPFSRENRRFTMSLIAGFLIAALGLIAFAFLSDRNPSTTVVYGTVIGTLCTVLIVQVFGLFKIGQVSEKLEEGQQAAMQSRTVVHNKLSAIEEKAEAGTATAVVSEVQRNIGKQLLADPEFIRPLARQVADIIRPELTGIADDAARKAVELYRRQVEP